MTLVLSIIYDGKEDSHRKNFWYVLTCIYLILLAGFRYKVGGDTHAYMADFDYVPDEPSLYLSYIYENIELNSYMPGWSVINIICKRLFDSFYAVQLIQTTIVNICIFYLFKKYTKHIFLCALLYLISWQFFNFNTEIMREGTAVALCGIGMFNYMRGKKDIFYLLLICSAILFHVSASIVIIFPIVNKFFRHISFKTIIVSFSCAFVLWLISDVVVSYFPNFVSSEARMFTKILSYGNIKTNIFGFLSMSIHYLIGQAGIIYFARNNVSKESIWQTDYASYMAYFLTIAVLSCGIAGFARFMNYTIIFLLIMITEYVYNIKSQTCFLPIVKTLVLLICIYFVFSRWATLYPDSNYRRYDLYIPYTSIINETDNIDYRYYIWHESVGRERTSKNSRDF